jgi:hypothetical protein
MRSCLRSLGQKINHPSAPRCIAGQVADLFYLSVKEKRDGGALLDECSIMLWCGACHTR